MPIIAAPATAQQSRPAASAARRGLRKRSLIESPA
jgi:hypothetical protein